MSTEETIKGNKLIAIFDGAKHHVFGRKERYVYNNERGSTLRSVSARELKYHQSWDWLMPVLQKIKETHPKWSGFVGKEIFALTDALLSLDIEKTWLAAVQIIEDHTPTQ